MFGRGRASREEPATQRAGGPAPAPAPRANPGLDLAGFSGRRGYEAPPVGMEDRDVGTPYFQQPAALQPQMGGMDMMAPMLGPGPQLMPISPYGQQVEDPRRITPFMPNYGGYY